MFKTIETEMFTHNRKAMWQWMKDTNHWWWNEPFRWAISLVILCALGLFVCRTTYMHTVEISNFEYKKVVDYKKMYGHKLPDYNPTLAKAMKNGVITEAEFADLVHVIFVYEEEKDRIEQIELKKKVTKALNE